MKTNITDITFAQCENSPYIRPRRMLYTENGFKKCWDFIDSHDSAAIILHRVDLDALVLVRQFRPPIFARGESGYTYEFCAGLMDKDGKNAKQIAIEEAFEECGYRVRDCEQIAVFHNSVGISGARQYLFYARVGAQDLVGESGGVDGEVIECEMLGRDELLDFLADDSKIKTPGIGFGILWFLRNC